MPESLLIKNAHIVSPLGIKEGSLLIRAGKIARIGGPMSGSAEEVVDAKGLHLLPGVIDPHVHFREPGLAWKEDLHTGSRAAAAGGVTSFFEMPNTKPSTTTLDALADKKKTAAEKSAVNYNFYIGATADNLGALNAAENVPGIKIFMCASTGELLVHREEELDRIFKTGRRLIAVHAEDEGMVHDNKAHFAGSKDPADHEKIRSAESALIATRRAVEFSKKYGRRLHILHMTTEEEVRYLEAEKNPLVTCEVCPQHFLLSAPDIYKELGTRAVMNPPLREARHGQALWKALKSGLIGCIATDHAPHTLEEKDRPYGEAPAGLPGVETSLPLMLHLVNQGRCTLEEVVKWMCEGPASIFGVRNKGGIREGYDADLVLVDMNKTKTIENGGLFTKANWSPFDGWRIKGWPVMTVVNGQAVFREGKIVEGVRGREIQLASL